MSHQTASSVVALPMAQVEERLRDVETWLKPYAAFWDERIAALRHHLGEDIE